MGAFTSRYTDYSNGVDGMLVFVERFPTICIVSGSYYVFDGLIKIARLQPNTFPFIRPLHELLIL